MSKMKDDLKDARLYSGEISNEERMLILLFRLCDERGKQNILSLAKFEHEESKIISFPGSCRPGN